AYFSWARPAEINFTPEEFAQMQQSTLEGVANQFEQTLEDGQAITVKGIMAWVEENGNSLEPSDTPWDDQLTDYYAGETLSPEDRDALAMLEQNISEFRSNKGLSSSESATTNENP